MAPHSHRGDGQPGAAAGSAVSIQQEIDSHDPIGHTLGKSEKGLTDLEAARNQINALGIAARHDLCSSCPWSELRQNILSDEGRLIRHTHTRTHTHTKSFASLMW